MPRPLTAMQHACGRSTTSGGGNSILSGAMTSGWCVIGGNVANRTGTTASLRLRPSARAAAVPPRRVGTRALPGGLRVLRQASVPVPVVHMPSSGPRRAANFAPRPYAVAGNGQRPLLDTVDDHWVIKRGRCICPSGRKDRASSTVCAEGLVAIARKFFSRLHTKRRFTVPSSGSVRDCHRSSDDDSCAQSHRSRGSHSTFDPPSLNNPHVAVGSASR